MPPARSSTSCARSGSPSTSARCAGRAWTTGRGSTRWSGTTWPAFEAALPALGEPFFFSAEAPRELWDVSFPPEVVLVFGRESGGLPDELRARHADRMVCIPMADTRMRSLNVSTAVAIALYEVLRQHRRAP